MSSILSHVKDFSEVDVPIGDPLVNGLFPPPIPFSEIDQEWTSDELPCSDGRPMDSDWQRLAIALLVESVHRFYRDKRNDFYCGGDMFIYYGDGVSKRRCQGPDFFLVWGVSPLPIRTSWVQWKENGRLPNVIMELLSTSTRMADLTIKKDVYETIFCTPDYICYDPESLQLAGWRLTQGHYQALQPNENGRIWCHELGLWVGTWPGTYVGRESVWPRFFTPEGHLVVTESEAEAQRAAAEHQRADAEHQRADAEHQRADAERHRADAERQRADAAEAELARLKGQLGQK